MPVTPAFGRLRQEDQDFLASLGYTVTPSPKRNKNKEKEGGQEDQDSG